jgi:hypothetical protein
MDVSFGRGASCALILAAAAAAAFKLGNDEFRVATVLMTSGGALLI